MAAQLLANTDAVIVGTQMSSFDTHNNQGGLTGSHANLLARLGWSFYALRRFFSTPAYHQKNANLWSDVVVVTLSEFGRTTVQNGSNGTDHAEASVMLVGGGAVRGGVFQCGPDQGWVTGPEGSMFQVSGRYLRRSVDYRSVLGELIRDHLGASAAQLATIIPGYAQPAERLAAGGAAPDGTPIVGELGLI